MSCAQKCIMKAVWREEIIWIFIFAILNWLSLGYAQILISCRWVQNFSLQSNYKIGMIMFQFVLWLILRYELTVLNLRICLRNFSSPNLYLLMHMCVCVLFFSLFLYINFMYTFLKSYSSLSSFKRKFWRFSELLKFSVTHEI